MRKLKYVKLFEDYTNEDFIEDTEWITKLLNCKNKSVKWNKEEIPGIYQTEKGPDVFEWFFEPFTIEERKKLYNTYDLKRPEDWKYLEPPKDKYKYVLRISKLSESTKNVSDAGIERAKKSPYRVSVDQWHEFYSNNTKITIDDKLKNNKPGAGYVRAAHHTIVDDFMIKTETINEITNKLK